MKLLAEHLANGAKRILLRENSQLGVSQTASDALFSRFQKRDAQQHLDKDKAAQALCCNYAKAIFHHVEGFSLMNG